jgi:hypothetical protein
MHFVQVKSVTIDYSSARQTQHFRYLCFYLKLVFGFIRVPIRLHWIPNAGGQNVLMYVKARNHSRDFLAVFVGTVLSDSGSIIGFHEAIMPIFFGTLDSITAPQQHLDQISIKRSLIDWSTARI